MQAIKLDFIVSNNEAEYEAVILGLKVANHLSITAIDSRYDSQLVALQLQGEYEAKNERMGQYLRLTRTLMAGFKCIEVTHVPRSENQMADVLANLAISALHQCNVEVGVMNQPSI